MANRPKPTHLKVVNGTIRKDRENPREPQPKRATPICPSHLSDEAKVQWGRFSVQLEGMGVLTEVDGSALEQLVELYLETIHLRSLVKQHGTLIEVVTTQKETVLKPNPACVMLKAAESQLRLYQIEFGLTPASRTKVHTVGNPVPKEDEGPKRPAKDYMR